MNEEIKKILNGLSKKASIYKMQINEGASFNTDEYEANELLNYITNLQEENNMLKEENKELNRAVELYGKSLYNADLTRYKEENQKLNKIIDELEKILKDVPNNDASNWQYGRESLAEDILDELTELKKEVE